MCEVEFAHEKRSGLTISVSLFNFTTLTGEDQRLFSFPDLFWCPSFSPSLTPETDNYPLEKEKNATFSHVFPSKMFLNVTQRSDKLEGQ